MFYRKGSVVVPTAPYSVHHPWQVEWKKGSEIICYVGIVGDTVAVGNEEWQPKKFPEKIAMSIAVTTQGMNQRSIGQARTRMQRKPFATGAKSGSAVILKRPDFGRTDVDNGEYLDENKGCATWDESELIGNGKPDSIYLILHSASHVWFLSWVNEEDLKEDDVKICVIKKNAGRGIKDWHLLQLWKSDITVDPKEDQFAVTWASGDTFRINGGYCTYNQYPMALDVDEGGAVTGSTEYVFYYPNGAAPHGMIEINKPAVWHKSVPAFGNAPATENPTPNLNDDFFVCPKTKSHNWSVIVGHPVPSENAPCMFIVPRDFAQANLMTDIWNPGYGLIAVYDPVTETDQVPLQNTAEGTTITPTFPANPTLGGDLTNGYYLESGGEQPLPYHFHGVYTNSFIQNEAYWTKIAFRGVVVAHIDWNVNDSKWEIKQYHKGSMVIPNSTAEMNYVIAISPEQFSTWYDQNSLSQIYDSFWTTSLRSSRNDGSLNSGAELLWQDCNHIGNSSVASTLIKF